MNQNKIEPKVYGSLTQHLILLSKGHYGHSGRTIKSLIKDLRRFMHLWTGDDEKYFTDRELYKIVVGSFVESVEKHEIREHLLGIYDPFRRFIMKRSPRMSLQEQISSMIGLMGLIQIKEHDEQNNWYDLVSLPEPNPMYFVGNKE